MKKGSIYTDLIVTQLIGMVIFLLLVGFIITFVLIYQKRRIRHRQTVANLKLNFEHEMLKSQLEIQEQTLQTLSEEIHDNIGQVLSLAKLTLAEDTDNIAAMQEQRADTRQLIGKAITDLRDLSKSFSTDKISEIGLSNAIEMQLGILNRTAQLRTDFEVSGVYNRFPGEQELVIFRIFQELMNNTIRHARATHLQVRFNGTADGLLLVTSDNGCGFKTDSVPAGVHSGLGLKSIKKRVALFNGTFHIEANQPTGTKFSIFFPYLATAATA